MLYVFSCCVFLFKGNQKGKHHFVWRVFEKNETSHIWVSLGFIGVAWVHLGLL